MSLPPYTPESDKPSATGRAVVGFGSAVIAFIGFFFAGAFVLSFARADVFGAIGIIYAIIAGLGGVWLLKAPRYRGFCVGIFCAVACYLFLMMLAGDFSRGFWK
jgi:hypothetical protein